MASKDETWITVWVVMHSAKLAGIYGPIAAVYTSEEAAEALVASAPGDYKIVDWSASDRYRRI